MHGTTTKIIWNSLRGSILFKRDGYAYLLMTFTNLTLHEDFKFLWPLLAHVSKG